MNWNKQYLTPYIIIFAGLLNACNPTTPKSIEAPVDTERAVIKQPMDIKSAEPDYGCIYQKTNRQQTSTYPFNQTTRIIIYSHADSFEENDTVDSLHRTKVNHASIEKGKLQLKEIYQQVILNRQQTKTLFSILYDYRTKKDEYFGDAVDSYNPRHTIVFYNNEEAIAYLELCLECGQFQQSKHVDFGRYCEDKWCMLAKFFKSIGIKKDFTVTNISCPFMEQYKKEHPKEN